MTGKLRLEDLRVVAEEYRDEAWVEERDRDLKAAVERGKLAPWARDTDRHMSARPASIADWVEVGRQLGAEIVNLWGPMVLVDPDPHHIDVGPDQFSLETGSYLIFRLPVESPTPKERE